MFIIICSELLLIVNLGLWQPIVRVTVYLVSVQYGNQMLHLMKIYYIYNFLLVLLVNVVFVVLYLVKIM
jgi:hypothetical protein